MGKTTCRFRVQVGPYQEAVYKLSYLVVSALSQCEIKTSKVMAMQTAVVYGRLIASHARQLVAPLLKRQSASKLQLITACCGFSKDFTPAKNKFVYGEDAFFIARNSASDVLGEICFKSYYLS